MLNKGVALSLEGCDPTCTRHEPWDEPLVYDFMQIDQIRRKLTRGINLI